MSLLPLVVDLDGTLVQTDMLHESALTALRAHPMAMFSAPLWLLRGKASLKHELAKRTTFDPALLPYNQQLLIWLKAQKAEGRTLVLCTASDSAIATRIAVHLEIFDDVIASEGVVNLAGQRKAQALISRYGEKGFDYAGNSNADLKVWPSAREAIVVNATAATMKQAVAQGNVAKIVPREAAMAAALLRTLRTHQWLKNLLLFVPLLAAHQLGNLDAWSALVLAFLSFCLCASSVYIANDLLDLESDRLHPRKRARPFASGDVSIVSGLMLCPVLLLASLSVGSQVGGTFLPWLAVYFLLTCAYSWSLKRIMLVDCLTLAILYTLRIIAGAAAIGNTLSFWLLAFSAFMFLSLAFVKRYAELEVQRIDGKEKVHGRGYLTSDASLIQTFGIASGYASVVVLALYLNSEAVLKLYGNPQIVWGGVVIILFWISWMWMQAHRGLMHDDPLVFAVKDKASLLSGAAVAAILVAGTLQ